MALRAQVSGEVIDLAVDIGDAVSNGDIVAQLDGDLQVAILNQSLALLSSAQAEMAQAEVSIADIQSAVNQAQATLDRAEADIARQQVLAEQGAISQQELEGTELEVVSAQQTMLSAQARLDVQRQAARAAADRISAQEAVVMQNRQQLSDAELRSPLTGVVLTRQVDVGDFVESGATVLELGDLSHLKVTVQVSELDLERIEIGQSAQVQLDAFPNEGTIAGQIERISPVADETSRLVPVQVTIPNVNRRIGSGLLARVQFSSEQDSRVIVPDSALGIGEDTNTVFVIEGEDEVKAIARPVKIGERGQDGVEILSGLEPGESFVTRSDRPLTSGQAVRLSILSDREN
ncbi:MAG: efflux RND transporter periplasmic adaptor subunit [Cyanobacteria bacterium P01_E01_bin.34]